MSKAIAKRYQQPKSNHKSSSVVNGPWPLPPTTSAAYEALLHEMQLTHLIEEATGRSLILDLDHNLNMPRNMKRIGDLSERERKESLFQAYVDDVWISSPIDAIAKRITSGGYHIEPVEPDSGDEAHETALKEFFKFRDSHWDFLQFLRSVIIDLLIFGECFVEIVRQGKVPQTLTKIDCITMTTDISPRGKILGYVQQIAPSDDPILFTATDIMRFWLPSPKSSMQPFSPIEKVINSVYADKHMVQWLQTFFRKGAKHPYAVLTPGDVGVGSRFVKFFQENYSGEKNAHIPLVLPEDAKIHEFSKGSIDIDFQKGREMARTEKLAGLGVPPAVVGIIETGNIGGGTGESQDKAFQYNTTDPYKQLVLEKINYTIIKNPATGFGFDDYVCNTRYADYRQDSDVTKVQESRIHNGLATPNEIRQEIGIAPYKDAGDTPLIITGRDIQALVTLNDIADEHKQTTKATLDQQKAQTQLTLAQVEKTKQPPPTPVVVAPGQQPPQAGQSNQQKPGTPQPKQPAKIASKDAKGK